MSDERCSWPDCQCVMPDHCPQYISPMAQTVAQRQRAYKESMKEAGYVRLEAYVTKEQREKFRQLGGDEWLRKRIDRAKKEKQDELS